MGNAGKASAKKRPRGRPPLEPGRAKRSSFNTRIRSQLKEHLEREAKSAGRSLSEEIEHRLERSLTEEPRSEPAYRLMRLLGTTMSMVEQQTGKDATDYETYVAVKTAITGILELLEPPMSDGLRNQINEDGEKYPGHWALNPDAPVPPILRAMFKGDAVRDLLIERVREMEASARNTKAAASTSRKTD